eukprot:3583764-Pleurochrysis_carterae.AAC.1
MVPLRGHCGGGGANSKLSRMLSTPFTGGHRRWRSTCQRCLDRAGESACAHARYAARTPLLVKHARLNTPTRTCSRSVSLARPDSRSCARSLVRGVAHALALQRGLPGFSAPRNK